MKFSEAPSFSYSYHLIPFSGDDRGHYLLPSSPEMVQAFLEPSPSSSQFLQTGSDFLLMIQASLFLGLFSFFSFYFRAGPLARPPVFLLLSGPLLGDEPMSRVCLWAPGYVLALFFPFFVHTKRVGWTVSSFFSPRFFAFPHLSWFFQV